MSHNEKFLKGHSQKVSFQDSIYSELCYLVYL